MKNILVLSAICLCAIFSACKQSPNAEKNADAGASAAAENPAGKSPEAIFGSLFEAVQSGGVFPDSKTFPDCTPKSPPAEIMKKYVSEKGKAGFDLKKFVADNFDPPIPRSSGFQTDPNRTAEQHIMALWDVLTRKGDTAVAGSSLLPLPEPYVVPGGRFGEIYYWDSYFTMLGLEAAGRRDLIESMVKNFAYLIDTYGHIPNGNRTYYLSRSQPPFFSLMVELLDHMTPGDKKSPDAPMIKYLPQLEKEYEFWMDGWRGIREDYTAYRRVVRLDEGARLNRYWDDHAAPRPESWKEDVAAAKENPERPANEIYQNLKAGAESGWDFSSRWNIQSKKMGHINVVDILPIDLNCLIWHLEKTLKDGYLRKGDNQKGQYFGGAQYLRERAIKTYFFDTRTGWFQDFNWRDKGGTGMMSLAGMYPLWLEIAYKQQAEAAAKTLETKFLRPGGVVTTLERTGQQWDAPNGWAPLQLVSIEGLRRYGFNGLANTVKKRWVDLNVKVYKNTGRMMEKYNVEDLSLDAGGGEYPVQDGFGWTNGVLLKLLREK